MVGDREIRLAELEADHAAIEMGIDELGTQPDRLVAVGSRILQPPDAGTKYATGVPNLRVGGIAPDVAAVAPVRHLVEPDDVGGAGHDRPDGQNAGRDRDP